VTGGAPQREADLPLTAAVTIFACFAFAYFLSALIRAVVATLAPVFSAELSLGAADLGLLAGAYFVGFASTQLPLGSALDRFGAKRVLLGFLTLAVIGCALFAQAQTFAGLSAARVLVGMGVSACLMAPMTFFRRHFSARAQMRAASWMLMTGSFGMVASTLPVQWLLPLLSWRGIFWLVAGCLGVALVAIARFVPADRPAAPAPRGAGDHGGYRQVFAHRAFIRLMPIGFFHYGGLVALQALWIGPWLVQVCAWTPDEAARGLFTINLAMLAAFLAWGTLVPRLYARGWTAQALIARGLPASLMVLVVAVALGARSTAWLWALFCVGSTVVSLAQPAVGQAFAAQLAGRALSAYNLVIFLGVFAVQWAIGGLVDRLQAAGLGVEAAYQGAFAVLALGCIGSYLWFLWFSDRTPRTVDNEAPCQPS
jgi:predicted MFS family arabinose efflux permease